MWAAAWTVGVAPWFGRCFNEPIDSRLKYVNATASRHTTPNNLNKLAASSRTVCVGDHYSPMASELWEMGAFPRSWLQENTLAHPAAGLGGSWKYISLLGLPLDGDQSPGSWEAVLVPPTRRSWGPAGRISFTAWSRPKRLMSRDGSLLGFACVLSWKTVEKWLLTTIQHWRVSACSSTAKFPQLRPLRMKEQIKCNGKGFYFWYSSCASLLQDEFRQQCISKA